MVAPHRCRRLGVHNCNWCVTGTYKKPARKRERAEARRVIHEGLKH